MRSGMPSNIRDTGTRRIHDTASGRFSAIYWRWWWEILLARSYRTTTGHTCFEYREPMLKSIQPPQYLVHDKKLKNIGNNNPHNYDDTKHDEHQVHNRQPQKIQNSP